VEIATNICISLSLKKQLLHPESILSVLLISKKKEMFFLNLILVLKPVFSVGILVSFV
jgi:hypothetical protein